MKIEPQIDYMVATCGGNIHALATPTMKGANTDAVRSSARILRTRGHVISTGRDGTNPCDCNVAVTYPRDNGSVLIGGIVVPPTIGHIGSQDVLNKRQYTSPSVRRNTQKFCASVDENLADDGDSTSILRKLLGQELSDSLSADMYLRCRVEFTSNTIVTEVPNFVHLRLPSVNALDEFNTFGNPTARIIRPKNGSHWSVPGHVFGEATAVKMIGTR